MKNLKKYEEFNESIGLSGLAIGVSVLALISSIIRFSGSVSGVYLDVKNNKKQSEEEIKRLALKDSILKNIIEKINKNQSVLNFIKPYETKLENGEMTYNEMKKFIEDLKILLGDVLTVREWEYCDDVIEQITNKKGTLEEEIDDNDSDKFTKREIETLKSNGFEPSNNENSNFNTGIPFERKFSNKDLKIDMIKIKHNTKVYSKDDNKVFNIESKTAFKYFYQNIERHTGYIKSFIENDYKESGYFKSLQDCLDNIKGLNKRSKIDDLHDLIKLHQRLFKRSQRNEIIDFLSTIDTKEEAIDIINDYNFKYDDSLLSTLNTMAVDGDFVRHFKKLGVK